MQFLDTLFFYAFSCSTVLVYGIGLEKAFFESRPGAHFFGRIPALFLETLFSAAILAFISSSVLDPAGLGFLVPMASLMVCGIVDLVLSLPFGYLRQSPPGERLFFFGTVMLAVSEAVSFTDTLVIVCAAFLSFSILTAILFTIRERTADSRTRADWKGAPQVLVSMGLLYIVLYSADVSWWLGEVFQ